MVRGDQGSEAAETGGRPAIRGLIVDWGGVLTAPLDGAMLGWASRDGANYEHFLEVMRSWVGGTVAAQQAEPGTAAVAALEQASDSGPAGTSPVHRLERGELSTEEFERLLAEALAERGSVVPPRGLLRRMLGDLEELSPEMVGLVSRARAAGLHTALLSNSWGNHYPEHLWGELFDTVVISGRVGMRKPEPRIYRHTAAALGLRPEECVMIDDLPHNVRGAVAVGMVGIQHRSYPETVLELEAVLGRPLTPQDPQPAPGDTPLTPQDTRPAPGDTPLASEDTVLRGVGHTAGER